MGEKCVVSLDEDIEVSDSVKKEWWQLCVWMGITYSICRIGEDYKKWKDSNGWLEECFVWPSVGKCVDGILNR